MSRKIQDRALAMSKTLMTPSPVRLPSSQTCVWPKSVGVPLSFYSEPASARLAACSLEATSLKATGSRSPPSVLGAPISRQAKAGSSAMRHA